MHETSRRLGDVRNTLCVPARELVRTVCLSRLDETHLAECAAVGHTEWHIGELRDTFMRQVEDLAMCETHCACQLAELVRTVCFSRLDGTHLAECAAVGHTEWRARELRDA